MKLVTTAAAALLLLIATSPAGAATVMFSGTVSYSGSYSADSVYIAVIDDDTDILIAFQALAAGTPPFGRAFSVSFDNAGVGEVLLAALLDRDASGADWPVGTTGDPFTHGDVIGWYNEMQTPTLLLPSSTQSGLDFALPTGEIHGNAIFLAGQTDGRVETSVVVGEGDGGTAILSGSGPYELVGVYPGTWIVEGTSSIGDVCYGDATCASPTMVTLAQGEVRTGIDIDFSTLAVDPDTWGRVKSLYR